MAAATVDPQGQCSCKGLSERPILHNLVEGSEVILVFHSHAKSLTTKTLKIGQKAADWELGFK